MPPVITRWPSPPYWSEELDDSPSSRLLKMTHPELEHHGLVADRSLGCEVP